MADNKTYWNPNRTYDFDLRIGGVNLTADLQSLTILTSVDMPYQSFILQILLDPTDVILEQIYGQTPLKLSSRLYGTSPAIPLEQIDFELMYLTSDIPVEVTIPNPQNIQKDRQPFTIVCVSRPAYTTMNSLVADIYHGSNMNSIISNLISKTQATPNIDGQKINTDNIDQCLIPSSTLYKNLQYLDKSFGMYDGMGVFFCNHDNTVFVKNLSSKMTTSSKFIVYQLPLGKDNREIINKCSDGKHFYTTKNVDIKYNATSAFAYMSPTMKHVVKPKDRLYHTIDIDLPELSKDYGLICKDDNIYYDERAMPSSSRISVHKDHSGSELSETFIRAKYARRVSTLTEVKIEIENSMKLLNLMEVGEAVEIDTGTATSTSVNGSYILRASHISFMRVKDWESSAMLHLMRTNKSIG